MISTFGCQGAELGFSRMTLYGKLQKYGLRDLAGPDPLAKVYSISNKE